MPLHAAKVHAAVRVWVELRLDIVCVQETHHSRPEQQHLFERELRAASEQLHAAGWVVASSALAPTSRAKGVIILLRSDLASSLQSSRTPAHLVVSHSEAGRLTQFSFKWGGHQLHLLNVYFPTSAQNAARKEFLERSILPVAASAAQAGDTLLVAGDFNFVADPQHDSSAGPGGRQYDAAIARLFQDRCQDLVDTHRFLHPHRRDFTHLYRAPHPGGSRLDRVYSSSALLPFVAHTSVSVSTPSDHRVATVQLLPRVMAARGPGVRRVRTFFTAHSDLRQSMEDWIVQETRPKRSHGLPKWVCSMEG
ncbi:hypothetical protein Agub_g4134 [Astrephomene gubernaculifera]|uniref:Endonuclease/exonuclease/phosphatase domain-containing protein n=1 Tax=Astrephomene gubernaculifera TaxID=47775 RepID=A0AAD3DLT3_9CHLO|nr:hypothetical protein Agub_g4134 [Astrephomene gubernaculifera]